MSSCARKGQKANESQLARQWSLYTKANSEMVPSFNIALWVFSETGKSMSVYQYGVEDLQDTLQFINAVCCLCFEIRIPFPLYFKSYVRFSVFYQIRFYCDGSQKLVFCICYKVIWNGSCHPVELVQEGNYLIAQRITNLLTGPEATSTNTNTRCSFWASGNTFLLWGRPSTGTGCPGRLWSLHSWRSLKASGCGPGHWL